MKDVYSGALEKAGWEREAYGGDRYITVNADLADQP